MRRHLSDDQLQARAVSIAGLISKLGDLGWHPSRLYWQTLRDDRVLRRRHEPSWAPGARDYEVLGRRESGSQTVKTSDATPTGGSGGASWRDEEPMLGTRSEAVKRPSYAAPQGGSWDGGERIAALERQLVMVFETQ